MSRAPISTAHAPPWRLVAAHFLTAASFAAAAGILLACGLGQLDAPLNTGTLALAHLWAVGWLTLTAVGVLVQFAPVTFQSKLFSVRLAWTHLVFHAAGVAGLAVAFVFGMDSSFALLAGGSLWLGLVLATINIAITVLHSPRFDLWAIALLAALAHAVLTPTAGWLVLRFLGSAFVVNHHFAVVVAHAHLGLAGWLFGLVIAVGGRLLPMFLVAPEPKRWQLGVEIALLHTGVLTLAGGVLVPWLATVGTWLIAIAVLFWVGVMASVFNRRVRRKLDAPLTTAWMGVALLAAAVGLAIVARTRVGLDGWASYGLVAIGGAGGLMVNGLIYKIVPFLVRLDRWRRQPGNPVVPGMADVLAVVPHRAQVMFLVAGFGGLLAALLAHSQSLEWVGRAGVCIGTFLFFINVSALVAGWPPNLVLFRWRMSGASPR